MGHVTKAVGHLTVSEIDQRIQQSQKAWQVRRWLVIRHALADPQPARVIGSHVGLAERPYTT